MDTPIFVVCSDGDVLIYDSPGRALAYVESPEVEDGDYPAVFDMKGRRYALIVPVPAKVSKGWFLTSRDFTPVILESLEDEPTGAEALRLILLERLSGVKKSMTLEQLIEVAKEQLKSP